MQKRRAAPRPARSPRPKEKEMTEALLVLYAYLIPAVPLWGWAYFKKAGKQGLKLACLGLFALQRAISTAAVVHRFF